MVAGRAVFYFVMGRPTTDEMDVWRIPVFATPPVTPERITTHNARVAHLWVVGRSHVDLFRTADDGSGQWLYALDSEHRIPHRVSSGITEQYLSVTVSNTEPRGWSLPQRPVPTCGQFLFQTAFRPRRRSADFRWQIHVQ